MSAIHFLPLLPEVSAPFTPTDEQSTTSSASSSRSSSISYSTGPTVHSLLGQIKNLTASISSNNNLSTDIASLNREIDYLAYFISAPLSLTHGPVIPGSSRASSSVELQQFNQAIRELNNALAGLHAGSVKTLQGVDGAVESRHRHKLTSTPSYHGDEASRLRLLRRFE